MEMKIRALWLSAALAVVGSTIAPVMADEWNKETRIEINQALEVPGKVLPPGKYIFKLADDSDRHVVEIYAVDDNGKQTFVTTVLAISAYSMETPDRAIIRLEERPAGSPQAIHTWFYPGDNAGWEFVYPKSERLQVATVHGPAEQPELMPVAEPALPEPPAETEAAAEPPLEPQVEEPPVTVAEEAFVFVADEADESEGTADRMLPDTAGHSMTELTAGVTMLGFGLVTMFAARRREQA
jgi:hypothetical protein